MEKPVSNGSAPPSSLDYENIEKALFILTSISSKRRRDILKYIETKKSVRTIELMAAFNMVKSRTSQELAILKKAGLITFVKKGQFTFHSVDPSTIKKIAVFIKMLLEK